MMLDWLSVRVDVRIARAVVPASREPQVALRLANFAASVAGTTASHYSRGVRERADILPRTNEVMDNLSSVLALDSTNEMLADRIEQQNSCAEIRPLNCVVSLRDGVVRLNEAVVGTCCLSLVAEMFFAVRRSGVGGPAASSAR